MLLTGKLPVLIHWASCGQWEVPRGSVPTGCPHHAPAADHPDLMLSPQYKELEHRSLQAWAEMKTEAVSSLQEKTTGDGWLSTRCPCSWFSRMILPYISALPLLPSWCSSRRISRCSAGEFKNIPLAAKTFPHVIWGFRGSWNPRRVTKPKAGYYLFSELLSLEVITQRR